jgi:hypothetical protein
LWCYQNARYERQLKNELTFVDAWTWWGVREHSYLGHKECSIWGSLLCVKHIKFKSEMCANLIPGSLSQNIQPHCNLLWLLKYFQITNTEYKIELFQHSYLFGKMKTKHVRPSEGTGLYTNYITVTHTIVLQRIIIIFIDQKSVYLVFKESTFYADIKIFNSLLPNVTILKNDKAKF